MKTRIKETKFVYIVEEYGKDTDRIKFEKIGFITKDEKPELLINDDFSGIIELDTLKEIVKFMESLEEK